MHEGVSEKEVLSASEMSYLKRKSRQNTANGTVAKSLPLKTGNSPKVP